MKQLLKIVRDYKLFSIALLALIVALVLELLKLHTAANWVLGTTALIAVVPLLWDMFEDVRSGSYGVDILAITAIVTSVLLHQYWAALVVVLMLTGGKSLERYAERRAKRELSALLAAAPHKAHVIRKGKTVDVKASEVVAGDKILIKPGEVVPVDAIIIEGAADFNESSLTGESLPQLRQVGDTILSGSVLNEGVITAKAIATAQDSQYQQIIKLVRNASASKSPFVRLADRYSIPFTFAAFAIAVAAWVVTGESIRFLEVIIVATPCPLILAAPIALMSGMARASKYGIIVKTGSALERLAETQTIAFDKTGTLTSGLLQVTDVTTYHGYKKNEVVSAAASLEKNSHHVLAAAIVSYADSLSVTATKAKHVQEVAGRGLAASLKGRQVLVGRLNLLTDNDVLIPAGFKPASVTETVAFVAINGELAGVITLADEPRPESKTTLARLRSLGIKHSLLITGDNAATAKKVAKLLGIETVHADAMPADKLQAVEAIKHRPLTFVGDGVNDAPVLTVADTGIAMGARGSTAASESADIVILQDSLSHVATAVAIAKRTFKIARQSILVGIGLSLLLMLAFATGKFSPLTGAILQEVVDVVVIFNALRAHFGQGEA